jgi:hypothetical protein
MILTRYRFTQRPSHESHLGYLNDTILYDIVQK